MEPPGPSRFRNERERCSRRRSRLASDLAPGDRPAGPAEWSAMSLRLSALALAAAVVALGLVAGDGRRGAALGADPCSHGKTGKDCRPDPQPTNGKDCEDHGKRGGVNEDHCAGTTSTTTETTPTGTTPTGTTPTDSTPTVTTPTTTTPPPPPPGTTTSTTPTPPSSTPSRRYRLLRSPRRTRPSRSRRLPPHRRNPPRPSVGLPQGSQRRQARPRRVRRRRRPPRSRSRSQQSRAAARLARASTLATRTVRRAATRWWLEAVSRGGCGAAPFTYPRPRPASCRRTACRRVP